jgi:hypothetical protein
MPMRFTCSSSFPGTSGQEPKDRLAKLTEARGAAARAADHEDVPATAGRPDRMSKDLLDPSADTIADHRTTDAAPGRDRESVTPQLVSARADGQQRVVPAAADRLQSGEVAWSAQHLWLVHRVAPACVWARAPSGRQLPAALGASGRQNLAAALRLHPGAEAMLLGAMSLLGLIRLLGHRWAWWLLWSRSRWWTGSPLVRSDRDGSWLRSGRRARADATREPRGASTSGG